MNNGIEPGTLALKSEAGMNWSAPAPVECGPLTEPLDTYAGRERLIVDAYKRGAWWVNATTPADAELLDKAAHDYADATLSRGSHADT